MDICNIAVMADTHFDGTDNAYLPLANAIHDMISKKVKLLLIPGDVFDTPNIASKNASTGYIYERFIVAIKPLLETGCKIILIPGNHDIAPLAGTSLDVLKNIHENMFVIRDTHRCSEKNLDIHIHPIWWKKSFPPHIGNGVNIVIAHGIISGTVVKSTEIGGNSFIISQDHLDSYHADHYCIGHIHDRRIKVGKYNYVGALRQMNFGEEGNPAGYEMISYLNGKFIRKSWIDISSHKYYTFNYREESSPTSPFGLPAGVVTADYVKIRYKEEHEDETLKNLKRNYLHWTFEKIPKALPRRSEVPYESHEDPFELLRKYAVANGLNTEELINKARELV